MIERFEGTMKTSSFSHLGLVGCSTTRHKRNTMYIHTLFCFAAIQMALGQFSRRRIMLFFYFTTRVGQKVPRQNKSIFMTVKTKASSKNISVTIIPSDEEADKTLIQTFLFSTTLKMSILHQQQNENGTVHAHTRTLCSFFFFFFFCTTDSHVLVRIS